MCLLNYSTIIFPLEETETTDATHKSLGVFWFEQGFFPLSYLFHYFWFLILFAFPPLPGAVVARSNELAHSKNLCKHGLRTRLEINLFESSENMSIGIIIANHFINIFKFRLKYPLVQVVSLETKLILNMLIWKRNYKISLQFLSTLRWQQVHTAWIKCHRALYPRSL